ncbi:MAG: LPS assembly protein LptD [Nitrospirota bacterium]
MRLLILLFFGFFFLRLTTPSFGEAIPQITLTSNMLEYQQEEDVYFAEGNAILTQGAMRLKGDRLWFSNKTRQLKGIGNITLSENENTVFASEVEYDFATQQGFLLDGRLFFEEENYTLIGKKIERQKSGRYRLREAKFTACDCPENPDWHIRAERLDITLGTYMVVKNLFFYADQVPIFYLPYLTYPVKTTRQSGLLIPNIGISSKSGLRYNQDLFLVLSQSQDMTFSLDFREKLGIGGGIEYRYALSKKTRGGLQVEQFSDTESDINRIGVRYQHHQQFSDQLQMSLNARYIDPANSLSALSDETADRSLQVIESNAAITYTGEASFGYLLARYTQDLTVGNNNQTLMRLPEVGWHLIGYPLGPLFFDLQTTHTHFYRKTNFTWNRQQIAPRLSLPAKISSDIRLNTWSEFRNIHYSRSISEDRSFDQDVTALGITLESDPIITTTKFPIRFSKKLTVEKIHAADSFSDIPFADEIDKIHDRESITLSLFPRLLTQNKSADLLSLRLTETYHTRLFGTSSSKLSDMRAVLSLMPEKHFSMKTELFYNWEKDQISAIHTDFSVLHHNRFLFSLGERYTQGEVLPQKGDLYNPLYLGDLEVAPKITFLSGRLLAKLSNQVTLAAETYYDFDDRLLIEERFGLSYQRQCWLAAVIYQNRSDRNDLFFVVSLKGLGSNLPKQFSRLFDWQ